MLIKIEYSQIVRRKMKALKAELIQSYGSDKAKKILTQITKAIRRLEMFPQSGTAVSSLYDVNCDYSYIFTEHNYFFYRMKDEETILILEMFHEKEDFLRKLFGIVTTSQETLDYWNE